MADCIFCKIVVGEIPSFKVFEDENFLAFLDVNPIASGHTLLIPKKHTDYIFELDDTEYSELMLVAKKLSVMLKQKLQSKKVGMGVEGFGVAHVHVHLLPINNPGEFNPEKAKPMDKEELQKIAEKMK